MLTHSDPKIHQLLQADKQRQQNYLNLIPSENYTSKAVREAVGSVLMHKYSEGNVGKRYYEGNWNIDEIEQLAIDRAKKVFDLPKGWHVNVQALAGCNANLAVYNALLNIGDTIMSMYLPHGGHLSHGWSFPEGGLKGEIDKRVYKGSKRVVSLVSKLFKIVQYKVTKETETFDYDEIEKIAKEVKPKLIISGGTAYPREIDHERMAEIAKVVNGHYLADIAHEAGLVAGGVNKSPIGIADVVTMTTHKTLRGPRGAIILCKEEFAEAIDRSVFPGMQGGPFDNNIAGIAVCLGEALKTEFKEYSKQVIKNAKTLAEELKKLGYRLVSGGTDKHLLLIDLRNKNLTGGEVASALAKAGIILNKNTVPFETGSAINPSGIRLGTPTVTTRGMKEKEMREIARLMNEGVKKREDEGELREVKRKVEQLCKKFPLP